MRLHPEQPYSKADLNYLNPVSRCNKEKLGGKDIPVKRFPENFEEYDTVLIGFPIWYAGAPNVVNCFCGKLDFTGKKAALFITSAASGVGKSAEKLAPFIKGAKIADARRFGGSDDADIKNWVEGILA